MAYLAVIVLAMAGNVLIYAGLAFINGQLVPGLLGPVYGATGAVTRSLIMLGACAAPANFIMATAYRITGPGAAGMAILATLVLVLIAKSLVLVDRLPTVELTAATAVTIVGALWVVHALERMA